MEWENKISEARYTSPSEKTVSFLYGNVSKETDLKTGLFTFPDKDGAMVQHQGAGAMSFPLTCIFNGSDCIEKADRFEAMLFEQGIGELQHPVYGVHKVVPHGKIKRIDDLISGLNDSIVEVTFVKVITDENIPKLQKVEADEIEKQYEDFANAACEDFAAGVTSKNIDDELMQKSILNTQTENIKSEMEGLVSSKKEKADFFINLNELKNANNKIFDKEKSSGNGVLNVARFVFGIMNCPSRAVVSVSEKIKKYNSLARKLMVQFKNDPFGKTAAVNSIMTARLSLGALVGSLAAGAALQVAENAASNKKDLNNLVSRSEALNAAGEIENLFWTIKKFDDEKVKTNKFVDKNADSYFGLYNLIYKSILLIINASFALPMQRTVVLDRDRQLIELSAELYGSVDYVDSLIFDNKLTADEITVLPMGKEITYYVKSA
ncbi:DNA circularization N-terminal domain-containing protein [Treponema denticola]|uniref:DNA circularization N-terminal domain-containing protein n=1 Tax=Treponema denticola TaxID=158 RepID=UPI0002B58702|nr:DNA circularization N-terminal domain-containing protein [Treponema denticola]EMB43586.1 hypothetical protein HMPREF9730_02399 [Treponema denticola AL-2]